MSAVFVTATGTDIGKTFVAAGLIRQFRMAGQPVEAIKPVATGFDPADAAGSDPAVLLAALQRVPTPDAINQITPWRFAAPLSPDMAAQRESRSIDFGALVEFTRNAISRAKGILLIEGIGGVMVPLDDRHTVLDWMAALNVPMLLVTGSYLGSLSHTLTALDATRTKNLAVEVLVVNESADSTVTLADTINTLSLFAAQAPIIPLSRNPRDNQKAFAEIAALL